MVATVLEGMAVVSLVFDLLVADTGAGGAHTLTSGRIYVDQVPQSVDGSALVVRLVSSTPTNTMGGVRVVERTVIDVAAIGAAGRSYWDIRAIAKRVDVLIQQNAGLYGGVRIVELVKGQTVAFTENDAKGATAHIVQTYATPAYAT